MNWLESIDLYCERTGPELWSEPLNALSNLAFIGVAALLWRRAKWHHASGDIAPSRTPTPFSAPNQRRPLLS